MVQVWLGPRQQGDSAEASWAAITDTPRPWSKSSTGAPQMGPVQPGAACTGTPLPHAHRGWNMRDGAHRPGSYPCTACRPLTLQGMSDEAATSHLIPQMICLPISTIATPRAPPAPMTGLGCRGPPERGAASSYRPGSGWAWPSCWSWGMWGRLPACRGWACAGTRLLARPVRP